MLIIKYILHLISVLLVCIGAGIYVMHINVSEGFILGVGTHLAGGKRDIIRTLDMLQEVGVMSIRDDATWSKVEQKPGELKIPAHWDMLVDEALKRGIKVLWILAYGNPFYDGGQKPKTDESRAAFARYAAFVASHFKGRVLGYEIWNEWELTTGNTSPGSPEDYAALVRAVVPAIRRADPKAKIFVGAVGSKGIREGYLQRIIELGVLDGADFLSLHTYIHCSRDPTPKAWADWMWSLHDKLALWAGKPIDFYITEMGWPSNEGACGVSEEKQAEFLVDMFMLAEQIPFIKGIWWYDFQNDGPDRKNREHNFGLVDENFNPKPAYFALDKLWKWK